MMCEGKRWSANYPSVSETTQMTAISKSKVHFGQVPKTSKNKGLGEVTIISQTTKIMYNLPFTITSLLTYISHVFSW